MSKPRTARAAAPVTALNDDEALAERVRVAKAEHDASAPGTPFPTEDDRIAQHAKEAAAAAGE